MSRTRRVPRRQRGGSFVPQGLRLVEANRRSRPGWRAERTLPQARYALRVPGRRVVVIGTSPRALALAAYVASRGGRVSLFGDDGVVIRALRRQGGVAVEVVDDYTRVVPVAVADPRALARAQVIMVADNPARAALQAMAVSRRGGRRVVVVLDGLEAFVSAPGNLASLPGKVAWFPGSPVSLPGSLARHAWRVAAEGGDVLVRLGQWPLDACPLGPAAVRLRRVAFAVTAEVVGPPDQEAALESLRALLPMLVALA